jgi:nitroimidazol reductase NimA-like FMN-containing flavoprotein (pyridoxamine 5'-phosphate oxidase superfamily)
MHTSSQIRALLKTLFDEQRLAVLATHQDGQPYATLVAFGADDGLATLFFATPRATRKFANLSADPRVALLVNNSTNQAEDIHRAMAATATGRAFELEGSQRDAYQVRYIARHPHLEAFVRSPSCALIAVRVERYVLVHRFQTVLELRITP